MIRSFLYALVAMALFGASFTANSACFGPVGRTDTLWLVALELRPDPSISPQRMMLALLKANPDAFSSDNVNALNAGSTLCFDESDAIEFDERAAVAEVHRHNREWQSVRIPDSSGAVTADSRASRTDPPRTVSESSLKDGQQERSSRDLGLAVVGFEMRLGQMEEQLEKLRPGGTSAHPVTDAQLTLTLRELASTLERLLPRLERTEREMERLRSLATNSDLEDEFAALQSRVSVLEAAAAQRNEPDTSVLFDEVAAVSRVASRIDEDLALLAQRVANNEEKAKALIKLLEAESEAIEVLKSSLLRSLRLISSASVLEGARDRPAATGQAPAPRADGEGAMEPMPTPAPRADGEGAMEPMPTPAPRADGEGAMEPMPTPAPRADGEGSDGADADAGASCGWRRGDGADADAGASCGWRGGDGADADAGASCGRRGSDGADADAGASCGRRGSDGADADAGASCGRRGSDGADADAGASCGRRGSDGADADAGASCGWRGGDGADADAGASCGWRRERWSRCRRRRLVRTARERWSRCRRRRLVRMAKGRWSRCRRRRLVRMAKGRWSRCRRRRLVRMARGRWSRCRRRRLVRMAKGRWSRCRRRRRRRAPGTSVRLRRIRPLPARRPAKLRGCPRNRSRSIWTTSRTLPSACRIG